MLPTRAGGDLPEHSNRRLLGFLAKDEGNYGTCQSILQYYSTMVCTDQFELVDNL